jgi:hypothetical protein
MTREEAARRLKVDRVTFYRWEKGTVSPGHGGNLVAYFKFLQQLGVDLRADSGEVGRANGPNRGQSHAIPNRMRPSIAVATRSPTVNPRGDEAPDAERC